jgi:toxin ParE1/3/4
VSPSVVFTPEAENQLAELYRYIAAAASAEVAARYTEAIVAYCEELAAFPHRGSARDDIRSGLRTIGFRRRNRYCIRCVGPDRGDHRRLLRRARLRGGSE